MTPLRVSPLAERVVEDLVRPDGVRWLADDGVRVGAPVLARLVVLPAGLKVVAEPVTAWWKYGERELGVSGLSSGTSVRVPTRGESSMGRGSLEGMDGRLHAEGDDELEAHIGALENAYACTRGYAPDLPAVQS